jgi:hypothetical protein
MRRRGKELSPDFVLFHEEPHEQLIPHLDGFHVRDYYEKSWYRGYPGAVGVPLFSYLYHEYAIGYGGDSAGLSKFNSRWLVRAHAMNLIAGRTPGGAVWSSQQSMFDAHPDQIAMLRNHCRLLKTPAGRFLMLGKMLHPYELDAPKLAIDTPAGRGARADQIATPAILTSSWQAPAGHVGHLFVNIAEAEQPLRVMLDTRNAPAVSPCEVVLRRFGAAESAEPLWRGARLPREFSVRMAPLEAVFLEIREAESPGEG